MTDPLQSFLDQGTVFEGKIAFSGAVRIDGHFKGEAAAEGTLIVGEAGTVEADLQLRTLIVQGTFRGSVKAKERVEVSATGVLEGDVDAPSFVVAEGARIEGSVRMGERVSR
jgi:cytoskeletal protein CcmA (bactofilin family)